MTPKRSYPIGKIIVIQQRDIPRYVEIKGTFPVYDFETYNVLISAFLNVADWDIGANGAYAHILCEHNVFLCSGTTEKMFDGACDYLINL